MEISFDPPLLYQKLISSHNTESGNISVLEASLAFFSNVFSSATLLLPVAGHHTGKAPPPHSLPNISQWTSYIVMTLKMATENPTACLHLQRRAGMLKVYFINHELHGSKQQRHSWRSHCFGDSERVISGNECAFVQHASRFCDSCWGL